MKKLKIVLMGVLAVLASCAIAMQGQAYAQECPQLMLIEGCGKIEVKAKQCVLDFNVNVTEQEFENGQQKINDTINAVTIAVKNLNEQNVVQITYSSCYPVYKHNLTAYSFSCGFNVKTSQIDQINSIVNAVAKEGEISYHGSQYLVEDISEYYAEALLKAKQDAIAKALAFCETASLKAIVGTQVYDCCYGEQNGNIVIEATIKAVFTSDENTEAQIMPLPEDMARQSFC